MDEKFEGRGQELYNKLNSEYLIECAENNRIDEWNAQYLEYLELEWNRLYHPGTWDENKILELVRHPQFRTPHLNEEDFYEAISRGLSFNKVHLEGQIILPRSQAGAMFNDEPHERGKFYDAHLEGSKFYAAHFERAFFYETHLEGALFFQTHLEMAIFWGAHLEEVQCFASHLHMAEFKGAHLEGAKFQEVYIEGATFLDAHLEGAEFTYAVVDGGTLFTKNTINDKTNFTGTALSAARIDPSLRTRLERNIREIQWRKWYDKPKISPLRILKKSFGKYGKTERLQAEKSSLTDKVLINPFVRLFWWLSDYGSSCKRCLASFAGLIVLAFIVNLILIQSTSPDIGELFANTILALFGVGDPGLLGIARLWQVVYVVSGYFLLAVLISRFAIMFQNTSP